MPSKYPRNFSTDSQSVTSSEEEDDSGEWKEEVRITTDMGQGQGIIFECIFFHVQNVALRHMEAWKEVFKFSFDWPQGEEDLELKESETDAKEPEPATSAAKTRTEIGASIKSKMKTIFPGLFTNFV